MTCTFPSSRQQYQNICQQKHISSNNRFYTACSIIHKALHSRVASLERKGTRRSKQGGSKQGTARHASCQKSAAAS